MKLEVKKALLPIRRVTQRLFRGRCANFDHLDETIALFNRAREAIESALASGGIAERTRARQIDYVGKFYDIINDPRDREWYIEERCRGER